MSRTRHPFDDAPSEARHSAAGEEDPRLVAAVKEYMAELEAGLRPARAEFLARYPGISDELSECLDGLAFVHSAAGQMQGDSGGAVEHDESAMTRPLGDFKLVREIGRGGMGVVYEAIQLSLGRRVAVKVLPFAATLDQRHLQRFRNEAQAAAQLHHTNIVPVYAVGCERSVHYYAMQLIEGQSLAEVVRELRRIAKEGGDPSKAATRGSAPTLDLRAPTEPATVTDSNGSNVLKLRATSLVGSMGPAENLSLLRTGKRPAFFRTAARLGLQAAEALDYAHNQGVVHRDVKPENLLLDHKGNLWITDFGLAQFYSENGLTQEGDLLGTLRYMSPEQASGRATVLDQRTDVYSLGLTLYELLTLERAMTGASREALLRQIDSDEPRSPRAIDRSIPPELETIVGKAAAKDPEDRYPTARALAEDLRRFLQDEPILARPPSLWDKAVKWTRRHRAVAVSALVMLVLIALGSTVGAVLIAREQGKTRTAYEHEREKATEANEQRARAEKSSKQARDAVSFFTGIAADELDKPDLVNVRKAMLEASLAYYQSFLEDRKDDPTITGELDAAQARVSAILGELSAFDAFFRLQMRLNLLSEASVQDDLKMTPEQRQGLGQLMEQAWRGRGGGPAEMRQMSAEQKREKFSKMAAEIEARLSGLLGPGQAVRLREIYFQTRGALAFTDPDVAEALKLTVQQKSRVRAIQSEFRNARFRGGPGFEQRPGGDRGPNPNIEQAQREAVQNVLSELTPGQVSAWQGLTGAPFTGNVMLMARPFGGPGGSPGGGPPGRGPDRR